MSRTNLIKIFINTLIGAILVVVWLKLVNLSEVLEVLKRVNFLYLALFFVFFIISTILRSLRLKILLKNTNLELKQLVNLTFLGQFLSFIIPIRAGEIAKSIYLSTQSKMSLAKVIIWILIDRFLDFWTVLLMLIFLFPLVKVNLPQNFYLILILIFGSFTIPAIAILINKNQTEKLLNILEKGLVVSKIKRIFSKVSSTILEGFLILRENPKNLPVLTLLSVLALISDAILWFIVFLSIGINLDFLTLLFGSLISMLTFLVPSAPGYVGSAEGAGLLVFGGILGLDKTLASAGVVLYHLITLITLPLFGLIGLYFLKFDLNLVWEKLRNK